MTDEKPPTMSVDDAEDFTAALGQVFGGGWRLIRHAQRQGIPALLGLTTEEWVRQHLGGYVRLSIEERHDAVAELRAEGLSNRQIAPILGVGRATVNRDARGSSEPDSEQHPDNGAASPHPVGSYEPLSPPDATADTAATTNVTSIGVAPDLTPVEGRAIDLALPAIKEALDKGQAKQQEQEAALRTIQPVTDIQRDVSRLFYIPAEDAYRAWQQQPTVSEPLSEALEVAMRTIGEYAKRVKALETGQVRVLRDVRQTARDHAADSADQGNA